MKVGLVSWPFFGYHDSIHDALIGLGHEVLAVTFTFPRNGKTDFIKYSALPRVGVSAFVRSHLQKFNQQLFQKLVDFVPDLVLMIKGDFMLMETVLRLKEVLPNTVFALWLMDPIETLPEVLVYRNHIDLWFVYEPDDILRAGNQYGLNVDFLPLAFDPRWYYPFKEENKETYSNQPEIDISFVGALSHPNRKTILNTVCKEFRGELKFRIIAPYYQSTSRRIMDRARGLELPKHVSSIPLDHVSINRLYQTSKINLNIHREEPGKNLNMRFFEIMGAGGMQLVERGRAQGDIGLSDGDGYVTYGSNEELIDKIRYYMAHPKEAFKIGALGGRQALRRHTFRHRILKILNKV